MAVGGNLRLAVETRWLGNDTRSIESPVQGSDRPGSPDWRVHGAGAVHLELRGGLLSVRFDGGAFDRVRCSSLIEALADFSGRISRIEFSVWSGQAGAGGAWISQSFATLDEARRFAMRVAGVTSGVDRTATVRAVPVRLEALPADKRGFLLAVLSDWSLDRSPSCAAMLQRFLPGSETADEGLKIARRFGNNLRFEMYRMATAQRWMRDQETLLDGGDLRALPDQRLARTLLEAVKAARADGGPILEEVSGLVRGDAGYRTVQYHRLTLPLMDPDADVALVATQW